MGIYEQLGAQVPTFQTLVLTNISEGRARMTGLP